MLFVSFDLLFLGVICLCIKLVVVDEAVVGCSVGSSALGLRARLRCGATVGVSSRLRCAIARLFGYGIASIDPVRVHIDGCAEICGTGVIEGLACGKSFLCSYERTVGHSLECLSADLAGQFSGTGFLVDFN